MKAKAASGFILIYIMYLLSLFYYKSLAASYISEPVQVSSVVLETAAHIPEYEFPAYIKVWEDEETDRALYVAREYVPTTDVEVGTNVSFGMRTGVITDRDEQGITIHLDKGVVEYGMSGTYVIYRGVPVGFISRAVSLYEVYAVFF